MGLFDLFSKKKFQKELTEGVSVVTLGKPFPWKEHVRPGDFTSAMLTATGFDVIISLIDLTEQEEYAIADEEFNVYIVDTDFGPFMVFQFGNNLKFDFSLNIHKMEQDAITPWLQNTEETIKIYVLEGRNSVVKAIRFVPFKRMYDVKVSCGRQLGKSKEEVDAFIHNVYAQCSIPDLMQSAQYRFTVPRTKASL